jgi:hypothetical protein
MKTNPNSRTNSLSFLVSRPQPTTVTQAIAPLQPQEDKSSSEWENLVAQAQRINQMAQDLEAALLEFKSIVSTLNSQRHYLVPRKEADKKICQFSAISIPWIKQTPNPAFILTTRKVDLFRAEREAALLAQQLRQQTKKKD